VFHVDPARGEESPKKRRTLYGELAQNRPEEPDRHVVRDGETVRCTQII